MKQLVPALFCLLLGLPQLSRSQNMFWAQSAGSTLDDIGDAVAADNQGNMLVTGYFNGSMQLGTTTLTSGGGTDMYVAKYSNTGNVLWAAKAGGTGADVGAGVAVDGAGNVLVTGYFEGNATFGTTSLSATGSKDIFVAKYSPAGALLWAVKAGGSAEDRALDIAADRNGNAYITGGISGAVTFGPTAVAADPNGDLFVAKCNGAGIWQWAKKGGSPTNEDRGNGIVTDAAGNCYVTGYFRGSGLFETTTLSSNGATDIVVAKYSTAGALQWISSAGGTLNDAAQALTVDRNGNVLLTGNFVGPATFGSLTLTGNGSSAELFTAKYSPTGSLTWAKRAGGAGQDIGYGIAVDDQDFAYVTGRFEGQVLFGSIQLTSYGQQDIFLLRYHSSGAVVDGLAMGGRLDDSGSGVVIDSLGNGFVTGFFRDSANLDSTLLGSRGQLDLFTGKFLQGRPLAVAELAAAPEVQLFPNPSPGRVTLQLPYPLPEGATLTVRNALGQVAARQDLRTGTSRHVLELEALPPGVYLVQLQTGTGQVLRRVVRE